MNLFRRFEDETNDNHRAVVSSARNWSCISSRFDGNEYSVGVRCPDDPKISRVDYAGLHDSLPGAGIISSFRRNAQMCDMTDASQRFASEAVGIERLQVGEGFDLRRRESFAENREIRFLQSCNRNRQKRFHAPRLAEADPDTASIVLYLQQLRSTLIDGDFDRSRSRVQTILYELLERVRGPLNDLESKQLLSDDCSALNSTRRTSPAAMRFTTEVGSLVIARGGETAARESAYGLLDYRSDEPDLSAIAFAA